MNAAIVDEHNDTKVFTKARTSACPAPILAAEKIVIPDVAIAELKDGHKIHKNKEPAKANVSLLYELQLSR